MEGDALASSFGCGVAEAEVTNGMQSSGQDVSQVAPDEFDPGDGAWFDAVVITAILPSEGHGVVADGDDTRITDDAAADISAQIFDGIGAIAEGLNVYAPVFVPHRGIEHLEIPTACLQLSGEVPAKGLPNQGKVKQEVGVLDGDDVPIWIDSGTGNNVMNVGMDAELLVPGVEDAGEPAALSAQSFVCCEFFCESLRSGGKEQVVGVFGLPSEKESTQLRWQGEGDHEVGSANTFSKFAFDPLGGGSPAALGAGAVVATVVGQDLFSAVFADIAVPAQHRSSAMGDGPDGAMRRHRKRRGLIPVGGQEFAQRADDRRTGHRIPARLTRKIAAEIFDKAQTVLLGLMGQMQVNHGGVDLLMPEERLHSV